jgi:hypothetical protein
MAASQCKLMEIQPNESGWSLSELPWLIWPGFPIAIYPVPGSRGEC